MCVVLLLTILQPVSTTHQTVVVVVISMNS